MLMMEAGDAFQPYTQPLTVYQKPLKANYVAIHRWILSLSYTNRNQRGGTNLTVADNGAVPNIPTQVPVETETPGYWSLRYLTPKSLLSESSKFTKLECK